MRMRKLRNLGPRMDRSGAVRITEPQKMIGNWRSLYPEAEIVCVEVGCGKGKFTVETAMANPGMLMIAIEKDENCLVMAMEYALRENVQNVFFISDDAVNLCDIFDHGEVDCIYLNFSDPWPRKKNAKRRLTSPVFLEIYKKFLLPGQQIHFKTDNLPLYEYSLEQFAGCGFDLSEVTRDLHENGPRGVMTDYESKFYQEGIKINRCVATLSANAPAAKTEE